MNGSNVYFLVSVAVFVASLCGVAITFYLRGRRSAEARWDRLLARLVWVDRNNVAQIALDVIGESGEPRRGEDGFVLESAAIWELVGGLEGVEVLERNCHVLVEMAFYLQTWFPEALMVAEQLRLNAREIEWHVGRLKAAAERGHLESSFAEYAQRATATYYLMTRHLLSLYEHASVPGLADLQRAI